MGESVRPRGGEEPVAEFWPMGLGLRRGSIPTNSSLPRLQRLGIYTDGVDIRNVFDRTWVPCDQIRRLYRIAGGFRVTWDEGGVDCSATVSAWIGINKITTAMEHAGYRFEKE